MKSYIREPINALTHLMGAVLSFIGTIFLVIQALSTDSSSFISITSLVIFGISLILLYTTSGIYHLVQAKDSILLKLKKLDHCMIFILIAGSYTPFCLLTLDDTLKWLIVGIAWSLAIVGVSLKIFWINMPRWLSTAFYIGMGWIAVFVCRPLYISLSEGAFLWLLMGGIMYTIGGIIYGLKKPNISNTFGFHELFHIFVMLGSACHYWSIFRYIL